MFKVHLRPSIPLKQDNPTRILKRLFEVLKLGFTWLEARQDALVSGSCWDLWWQPDPRSWSSSAWCAQCDRWSTWKRWAFPLSESSWAPSSGQEMPITVQACPRTEKCRQAYQDIDLFLDLRVDHFWRLCTLRWEWVSIKKRFPRFLSSTNEYANALQHQCANWCWYWRGESSKLCHHLHSKFIMECALNWDGESWAFKNKLQTGMFTGNLTARRLLPLSYHGWNVYFAESATSASCASECETWLGKLCFPSPTAQCLHDQLLDRSQRLKTMQDVKCGMNSCKTYGVIWWLMVVGFLLWQAKPRHSLLRAALDNIWYESGCRDGAML